MGWLKDSWDTVSNVAEQAMDKAVWAVKNPTLAKLEIGQAVYNTAISVKEGAVASVEHPEYFGQGVLNGFAGFAGDLAEFGQNVVWDKTLRHGVNYINADLLGNEEIAEIQTDYSQNAKQWAHSLTGINAPETAEQARALGFGEAIGDTAGLVAVTVATAGVGGAVVGGTAASVRGTAILSNTARSGLSNAQKTASFLNPFNSTAGTAITTGSVALGTHMNVQAEEGELAQRMFIEHETERTVMLPTMQVLIKNELEKELNSLSADYKTYKNSDPEKTSAVLNRILETDPLLETNSDMLDMSDEDLKAFYRDLEEHGISINDLKDRAKELISTTTENTQDTDLTAKREFSSANNAQQSIMTPYEPKEKEFQLHAVPA